MKNISLGEKHTLPSEETLVDSEGLMQLNPNQIPLRKREGDECEVKMMMMKARNEEMKVKRTNWRADHTPDHIPTNTTTGCNVARDIEKDEEEHLMKVMMEYEKDGAGVGPPPEVEREGEEEGATSDHIKWSIGTNGVFRDEN